MNKKRPTINEKKIIFDKTIMRNHLNSCSATGKQESFLKHRVRMDKVAKPKSNVSPDSVSEIFKNQKHTR